MLDTKAPVPTPNRSSVVARAIVFGGPCSPNSKHARSPHGDAAAEVLKVHDSTEIDNDLPDRTG